ncbi:MAG TPA: ParB/RepB/Spo0J family partition protein [Nocardioides sp.]|uniref:ParB/RepB/Spo0J family partition protein n=1 Tax=Nocardioides sp. TaxID=35761 RepID=UPI002CB0B04F|nr:ParB/RepB/Spo0J family partition protein [Nocardioides sp.]HTW17035.1 ParB/RepB/Spo0J family partition protein [Nocardioides sp.]
MSTTTETTTSTYEHELDLTLVVPHPKNVRRKAVADDELVASIKASGILQPLIVAPHTAGDDTYVLIAGHRRLAGAKKARLKVVPAIVRTDLVDEASQVEAMLVENGRRKDLSPIEEAEGYEQLALFGRKVKEIAEIVGVDPKTVTARRRLLKLAKTTQTKVHAGDLTLDDALAIASFADDPATTKKLEKAAGSGNLRYELEYAKGRRKNRLAAEKRAATDYPDVTVLESTGEIHVDIEKHKVARLAHTGVTDREGHKDCLAAILEWGIYNSAVILVCTAPETHTDEERDEAAVADRARAERAAAEREARQEAIEVARRLRVRSLAEAIKPGMKVDKVLVDLLRNLLPSLISNLEQGRLAQYFDLTDTPEPNRWERWEYSRKDADLQLFRHHVAELADASGPELLRTLVVVLAVGIEDRQVASVRSGHNHYTWNQLNAELVRAYITLAERQGHTLTDDDQDLLGQASIDDPEPSSTDQAETATPDDPTFDPHPFAGDPEYACTDCDQPADSAIHLVDDESGEAKS